MKGKTFDAVMWRVAVLLLLFIAVVGFSNRKPDLYKNMVNASVRLERMGSGVFIADNVVLTAAHVLRDETVCRIKLSNGTILESRDFYLDKKEDIGFVFVDADEIRIAKISRLPVTIGDRVYLVGAPFNKVFAFTLSSGIIAHTDRDFPDTGWKDLIQVDANGGYGSSGGPLYNSKGDLVGVYVGFARKGGYGISLCEDAKSILEAYERCIDARKKRTR